MKLMDGVELRMVPMSSALCFACGSDLHKAKECDIVKYRKQVAFNKEEKIKNFDNLYKRYKPNYYSSLTISKNNQRTYAETVKKSENVKVRSEIKYPESGQVFEDSVKEIIFSILHLKQINSL